jgi:hypothetical protein
MNGSINNNKVITNYGKDGIAYVQYYQIPYL